MSKQHTGSLHNLKLTLLAVGSNLVLAGCAGDPSTGQFTVTKSAMNNAVSAGGPEYTPVKIRFAQDKLGQTRIAMNDKEYDQAKRLAQWAEWDVRVAERETQTTEAQKAVKDAQWGVMELHEEGMRDTQC